MIFEKVKAVYDAKGRRELVPTGEPDQHVECDDVLVAVGQENAFPWIERDIGIEFDKWGMPVVDKVTMQSTHAATSSSAATPRSGPRTSSGRSRTATTPRSRSTSCCHGEDIARAARSRWSNLVSQKMGIHEWSYDNDDLAPNALQGAVARQEGHAEGHQGRGRARLRPEDRLRRSAALPELRRADGVRDRSSASSATRASTSARWTASRSRRTARKPELRTRLNAPALNLDAGPLRLGRRSRPAASWRRTRTCACTAGCAPSAARPARGTCRNSCST